MAYRKRIAVLSGAGVSAESGLLTYRDNGGLWDNYNPMDVASDKAWKQNPGLVLDFYNTQREKLQGIRPNDAHRLLASLEERFNVDIVTQNVDNLHERAGSTRVLHLHGEVTKIAAIGRWCWETLHPTVHSTVRILCSSENRYRKSRGLSISFQPRI